MADALPKPARPPRSVLRNTVIGFGGDLLSYVFLFAASIVLARFLGPAGRGAYAMVTLLNVYLANVLILGVDSVTEIQTAKKEYRLESIHTFALVFAAAMGLLSLLIFFGCRAWLLQSVLRSIGGRFAFLAVLLVPFSLYSIIAARIMVGMTEIRALNVVKCVKSALDIAGPVLFLVFIPLGLAGAVIAWASSIVLTALIQAWWLFQHTGWKFALSREMIAASVGFGWKIYFAFLPENAIMQIDSFFLNHFHGAGEVGFYAIAYGLMFKIVMLFNAAVNASQSRIVVYPPKESEALVRRLIRHSVFVSSAIAVALLFIGRPLIGWLYGESFLPAAGALLILLIAMIANSAKDFLHIYVKGQLRRPKLSALVNWGDFFFGLFLYLWLIPAFGLLGTAIAASLIAVIRVVAYLWLLGWRSGSALRETFLISREDILFWKQRLSSLWVSFAGRRA